MLKLTPTYKQRFVGMLPYAVSGFWSELLPHVATPHPISWTPFPLWPEVSTPYRRWQL